MDFGQMRKIASGGFGFEWKGDDRRELRYVQGKTFQGVSSINIYIYIYMSWIGIST